LNIFNTLLVYPIFNLLAVIYAYVLDFGLAVIVLTIIVRGLLWPIFTRQLHSQKALQELQPELKKIKEKAAGDRTLEGKLTMELYKEREINPFASFLPLLLQLPIFFALFIVLRDIVKPGELAHIAYEPVKHLPAIAAIIHHTTTFHPTFLGFINLTKPSALLAALAAAGQFIQTKQITPKRTPGDSQAQIMASMTYLFPGLTFFIGLSLPGALPLYWGTASVMAIIQQHIVLNRDVRELEEGTPATFATPSIPAKATAPKPKPRAKRRAKTGKKKG
jgi:YidC/Oxa1 family membrane protein insertase